MTDLLLQLHQQLDDLVLSYRKLLDLVRQERDVLVSAQMDGLVEINEHKSQLIQGTLELEKSWFATAEQLAEALNLNTEEITLLSLARKLPLKDADQLRNTHDTLRLLVERTRTINQANEDYIQSALRHIDGAMGAIKKTLSSGSNYAKAGKKTDDALETSGRLMRKEV